MDFPTLNELIPHTIGKKLHTVTMVPYNAITLAMPGRHQKDTATPGGDFVVMVDDTGLGWVKHQFQHDHLFNDIEKKYHLDKKFAQMLMSDYARIILGADPLDNPWHHDIKNFGLHPQTFLYAVQCLAVAEHRRYGQHEARGGGRYLPARFSAGIVEGLWTAKDCKAVQRRGRMGLDNLIAEHGKPKTLKEWASE
jgi:hypothetical protein